ncbi:MAG: glutamate-5-semialdehyde dehydrogenase [Clostridia bacterium]|nr:glutamate-5-semialdehyde dehydrogenase [Clostridia bacterium]
MTALELMGRQAKIAARKINAESEKREKALNAMATALIENTDAILKANNEDLAAAKQNGMSEALQDRLRLTADRIKGMADGILAVNSYNDPIGKILDGRTLKNGLKIERITVPMGVIGIIYEARPNVTSDAAALCLKAGSACILRGGKEAFNSNNAITEVLRGAIKSAGLDENSVQLVQDTTRASATELMNLTEYLDVLIPRGGAGLIRAVVENSKVPVIETGAGNCHIYVDSDADIDMAKEIVFNAKTSRPSVCNAAEKLLIHKDIYEKALPIIAERLAEKNVELRGDERAVKLLDCIPATDDDWATEYNDYIMSVKVVDSIDEAIDHIDRYSTRHSEAIITKNLKSSDYFTKNVDSACVYVNASTRFTDGGEMGLGAEIGISTQKLHARGPMGLEQIVSYKYIIHGDGQVR